MVEGIYSLMFWDYGRSDESKPVLYVDSWNINYTQSQYLDKVHIEVLF